MAALIVVSSEISADAQSTQVWPEISLFTRLNDRMRFYFLATTVKESQESTEGEFGPNFDFYLRPFRDRKRLARERRSRMNPRGDVEATVVPAAAGSAPHSFEIRTPNAIAGVRGTRFYVYHQDNITGVAVLQGWCTPRA